MEETIARLSRGAGTSQNSGNPRSYCGHSPWTTKENGRGPHCGSGRVFCAKLAGMRSALEAQKDGDHDSASTKKSNFPGSFCGWSWADDVSRAPNSPASSAVPAAIRVMMSDMVSPKCEAGETIDQA